MARTPAPPRLLVLSQVYVPDPASVGQHMADAAEAMAARGYDVVVLTSARGYEDPSVKYPAREQRGGAQIIRLPFSSFGKRTILLRLLGQSIFLLQAIVRGLFMRRLSGLLVSTSPPMCSIGALVIHWIRRVPIKYWVMDLNPDQMIALDRIRATGLPARCFNVLNRWILGAATDIVVLDRFMADRVEAKRPVRDKVTILPPWSHVEPMDAPARDGNPFVEAHQLKDKFVVMYSGNHSIASPLTTLLDAALRLADEPRLHFMFIGGGLGKREVDDVIARHHPANIVSLPYQPLDQIRYSLSAADVHVVAMGDNMVGIIHPCKIYAAMSLGRPIISLGPRPSHITELLDQYRCGWHVAHGDVEGAKELLRRVSRLPAEELASMGERARLGVSDQLSKQHLIAQFCDVLERGLGSP